ncbi:hypothetical protein [Faecalibaculum rodentium]|uniref:hypothetical protein n=1 Tax=Faecalibaculum rodentium TaxID=1702221 RepID=UPI00272CC656|nr:hypothetical protein [Faecalibaculum rodentium]
MPEIEKNKHINLKDLTSEISHLGNVNSSNEDYLKVLEILGYKSSTLISPAQFDAILIKAAKTQLRGIRAEFTMMALGLLSGYERDIDIGTRRLNYLQYSNYTREFVKKYKGFYNEATPDQQDYYMQSLLKAEEYYIEKLANFLKEKMESGKLEEYIKDLSGYYDPVAETPILPEPEYTKEKKIKAEVNDDEDDMLPKSKGFEKRQEKDWGEQIAKELSRIKTILHNMVKILKVLTGAIILFSIIRFWQANSANMRNSYITSDVPPAETISSIDDIPIDDALLVEMDTFSIDEEDKIIPLAPGYSKKLPIKDPSPPDAAISTLEVQSSDENIVWEKDGYLTASDDIPAGERIDVYITIIAKKHKEIICVQVVSPIISDDAEGLVGGGNAE